MSRMTRRLLATFGIIAILALALTLLWRVYVHHVHTQPYDSEEPVVVFLRSRAA
ncbi:MAG TPA: hypothetical protein VKB93_20200 [Thermoanaerobaculia bacterium]|nr:hypothetical protein [Thermoanaerobaculia bacterium]